MPTSNDPLLQPFQLRHLTLRNRIMTTSHEPAYPEEGMPKARYRAYHVARAKGVTLSEIAEQPQILPKTGYTRQLLDKLFRPYRSKLRITMELASVGMIKRFVAAGLGVSIISESFAKDEVRSGEAKLIPISDVQLTRELGLVYRRDRTLPRAAAAFVALLRQQIFPVDGGHGSTKR